MIWIFERESETLELVASYSESAATYDIVKRLPGGEATKESFTSETAFRSRLAQIQAELEAESWDTVGPNLVADAWKI
jgi:hypothetical protein